ncbi:transcriptional regulator with XRE-family HTH domain [Halomonas cerina]|uniref:Transcriptional regulator with XRE-family HTH domain n=1 Tax=Halomonas cerina TaxID=447424 RepID=A0A839VB66_9GAMM|nr:transcriptional regulator with XRE-family HTH domain [Halomonas cerina]
MLRPGTGARLRALRNLKGISQRELAKRCGVTHSSLSLIEQGKVSPSVSSLKKILDAITMSVGDFFAMDLESRNRVFYAADELADVDTGREMIAHQGEEAGVLLEGEIDDHHRRRRSGAGPRQGLLLRHQRLPPLPQPR